MSTEPASGNDAEPEDENSEEATPNGGESEACLDVSCITQLIGCKHLNRMSGRVRYEYDMTLIAMLRAYRAIFGDDPAMNREYLGDS